MPRNGSGVYSPDWVNAAPSTTIESAKQNAMVADIVTDLNAARPVTAGGTGATTAAAARDALGLELGVDIPDFTDVVQMPGGRLTLATATPVTTTDQSAKTTIYYTPFKGNIVPIWDGSTKYVSAAFAELSLALDSDSGHTGYHQAGFPYDLFVINDAGTVRLATGPRWTSTVARATALAYKNGLLTNGASMTARFGSAAGNTVTVAENLGTYVGTVCMTPTDGETRDTAKSRLLWNYYNRVPRSIIVTDTTDSWVYSTSAFQLANASTGNVADVVVGVIEDIVSLSVSGLAISSGASFRSVAVGIGIDSSTVNSAAIFDRVAVNSNGLGAVKAFYDGYPGLGYHDIRWLESGGAADTQTWAGDNGGNSQTGLRGMVRA